jgi:hypothetical protein
MRLKTELYGDEQNQIIETLIKILDLDENNSCLLYDIDNDETKINEINKLIPTIRKYFSFSSIWGASLPDQTKRPWLSIVRQLTKRHYEMLSCDYRIVKDGQTIRTKKYIFVKKN